MIVRGGPQLDILDEASPGDAPWLIEEHSWNQRQRRDDMAVSSVPDEHFTVQLVSAGKKESVIMRERNECNFMVVLGESENCFLVGVVPNHDVGVVPALP